MAVKYKRRYGGYGPLKAKRPKKKYKTLDGYLRSVYNNNKEYLDSHIKVMGDSRKKRDIFIEEVKSRLGKINPDTKKKYTIREVLDKVQRTSLITKEERIAETHVTKLREMDQETFKDLRKKVGWTNKIKSENFIEELNVGKYYYLRYKDDNTGKDVIIEEERSPKGAVISWKIYTYEEFANKYTSNKKNSSVVDSARWARLKK